MKTSTVVRHIICITALLGAVEGWASRTMSTIPLRLEARADYNKDYLGQAVTLAQLTTAYGSPVPVANRLAVFIDIINLSATPQTGSLAFVVPNSGMVATTYCGYGGGSAYVFQSTLVLCPDSYGGGGGSHGATITTTGFTNNIPAPVNWSLGAFERKIISGELWSQGNYGTTAATGCAVGGMRFQPAFKITVNEDQGAIVASLIYTFMGTDTGGNINTCSGKSYVKSWDGFKNIESPTLPLPLNGGRPF